MAAVVFTFLAVLAVVSSAYWLLIARYENEAHRALQKRLRPQEVAKKGGLGLAKAEQRAPAARVFSGVQSLIDQSGRNSTAQKLLSTCAMTGLVVGLVVWMAARQWMVGGVAGLFASCIPYWLVKHAAAKRMRQFEEQFPEAIDLIARALRAGHAFPTGLSMVAEELDAPVGTEFKLLFDRQNYGMALPDALRQFAARVPIIDARFFVTAVLTQREAGGNLSGVLDNLSSVIRERFKVKRDVSVKSAQGRLTGLILMGLPVAMGAFQFVAAPKNFSTLIEDPLGPWMLGGAVVMQAIGWLWIQKVVNVEY